MANSKTLYMGESPFGSYKVIDMVYNSRNARLLFGNRASPQSGVALDDDPRLLFDYNQRFLELIMSQKPKHLLVIGGGAFMLPTAAFHQFPALQIDVVEIDPLLVTLARDYFDLPDDKRLGVHVMDGAAFIESSKTRYDMIIIDAFSGFNVPPQLINETAIKQYKRHLKRNGTVAINFISEYKPRKRALAHRLVDGFSSIFPEVALYQADVEYISGEQQNLVLVAGKKLPSFDYLQSEELELLP